MSGENSAPPAPESALPKGTLLTGASLAEASAVLVLVHGRGAGAQSMLPLAEGLSRPGLACLAPNAPGLIWYPYSFLAPLDQNEPFLSASLGRLAELIQAIETAGLPPEKVMLLGFSQGACLSLEFAARNPRRYGGIACLSGGLIGPTIPRSHYPGSLDGSPVFLGCSEVDPHIPRERVLESARVLEGMGAKVTARLYPAMAHTINDDELFHVRQMVESL